MAAPPRPRRSTRPPHPRLPHGHAAHSMAAAPESPFRAWTLPIESPAHLFFFPPPSPPASSAAALAACVTSAKTLSRPVESKNLARLRISLSCPSIPHMTRSTSRSLSSLRTSRRVRSAVASIEGTELKSSTTTRMPALVDASGDAASSWTPSSSAGAAATSFSCSLAASAKAAKSESWKKSLFAKWSAATKLKMATPVCCLASGCSSTSPYI
mmetsp:Transcript_10725/g.24672  ORF Transcript_10725/g.24672 Transcript_10725/m.24672 type:complete len:213 (-) Transcript_10725:374-1012(-)